MSPPTPEQEAALGAAAGASQTAVAAGAGAGKTTLMVEALWRDIEDDDVPLERILVAAYNRAAAAHLVARLQARFADADDGRGRSRAGLDLSGAWVGTFHSLAARIVRENPFVAGVDPEFGELDETESATLMEQALDEALENAMGLPGFIDLVGDARTLDGVRDATRQVHDRLRAAGHESPRIRVPAAGRLDDSLRTELEEAMAGVAAHGRSRPDHHGVLEAARTMLLSEEAGAAAVKLALNCAADLKPICERFNVLAARAFQALLDREAVGLLAGFAAHLATFADRYAELKRERGALDYEDLLLAARRVLRAPGHPYRFARVYVDEFQDVNALQAEIIDLLGAERTVVVGDGCQAIYGFRHADARHFVSRTGDPPAATLRDNHRSQEPLLRALNGLLGEALVAEPTFAPLVPMARSDRPGPGLADPPIEIVDVASAEGKATREQEAEAVAGIVESLIARGYEHRDIAVLFRALTMVEPYRAALAARGIPVHLVSGRGFLTHDQVADTLALLALVENPLDEFALLRVLASPYISAGDEDLLALRTAAGASSTHWPDEGVLWAAVPRVPASAPLVGIVDALRPLLRERGLPGLVEAAVEAAGYDLAVLGLADGPRRYANLRKLVRLAAAHASVRGADLHGFLGLMTMMAEAGNQDPGEATLVDPDLDAVRLATVHGVKGQEFPAVVIADASHGQPAVHPMVLVDADGEAGIRLSRIDGDPVYALGYDERRKETMAADAAEERRITYVASTRAERQLTVVGRSSAGGLTKHGAFAVLRTATGLDEPGIADFAEGGRAGLVQTIIDALPAAGVRPRALAPPVHPADRPSHHAPPPVERLVGRSLSFSALSTFATCSLRFHLEYERGLRRSRGPHTALGGGDGTASAWGGAALGDIVHGHLSRHLWSGPPPAPGWASAAAGTAGLPESPGDAERAESLVARLLSSPLADRVRAGRRIAVERPFALDLDGVLLSGFIDLMLEEGDGTALLFDWKTHSLAGGRSPAEILEDYSLQQALYGLAALRAGFSEVVLGWILLEDIAASPLRVVRTSDSGALVDEIRAVTTAIRSGMRAPAARTPQSFCTGCPGLDAMCPVSLVVTR